MSDLTGRQISNYLLLHRIQRSKDSHLTESYRGCHIAVTGEEVVIKLLRTRHPLTRQRMLQALGTMSTFSHPHLLPMLTYGEEPDFLFIVYPCIRSGSLNDLLTRVGGRFSAIQALPLLLQICNALHYLHTKQMPHGNIQPENILVTDSGHLYLTDPDLWRNAPEAQYSTTNLSRGTAEYRAPEQSLGLLRPESDIYALGVLLFHLLTGHPPFTGTNSTEILLQHIREEPPSARLSVASLSEAVDQVIHCALQKRAADRYPSALMLYQAYQTAVLTSPVASPLRTASASTTSLLFDTDNGASQTRNTAVETNQERVQQPRVVPDIDTIPTKPYPCLVPSPVVPDSSPPADRLPTSQAQENPQKKAANHWFAMLAVLLLLLGLLGVLLSTFFFPNG